jgi:hypothetical protein
MDRLAVRSVIFALALALSLVAMPPRAAWAVEADSPSPPSRSRSLTVYAGTAAISVLDTGAGAVTAIGGELGATFPLGRLFALELLGAAGGSAARDTEPVNLWIRLALGLRVERTDTWGLRPYGGLRLVHLHFAKAETWRDYPGASLLGDSSRGLDHRSGLGLVGGVSHGMGASRFRIFAELEPTYVPIGRGPQLFVAATFGFGAAL